MKNYINPAQGSVDHAAIPDVALYKLGINSKLRGQGCESVHLGIKFIQDSNKMAFRQKVIGQM